MEGPLFWDILKHFAEKNAFCFSFQEARKAFPERNQTYLGNALADMVETGKLYKIERGLFHIIPLQANPVNYQPDSVLVAKYLMKHNEYYIGFDHALKVHGISMQSLDENVITIVTNKQMRLARRHTGNLTYHFIHLDESRFFGYSECWINEMEKAMVSDIEKTIVDMATLPKHGGGIIRIARALYQTIGRLDIDKLFHYLNRNSHNAAKKRILFLTEILGMEWTTQHEKMMSELGNGINLLDTSVANQGKINPKFQLKININIDLINKEIQNQ